MVLNVFFLHPSLGKKNTIFDNHIFQIGWSSTTNHIYIYIYIFLNVCTEKNSQIPLHPGWRLKWLDSIIPLEVPAVHLPRGVVAWGRSFSGTTGPLKIRSRLRKVPVAGWLVFFWHRRKHKTLVVTKRREGRGNRRLIDWLQWVFSDFCLMFNMGKTPLMFFTCLGFCKCASHVHPVKSDLELPPIDKQMKDTKTLSWK